MQETYISTRSEINIDYTAQIAHIDMNLMSLAFVFERAVRERGADLSLSHGGKRPRDMRLDSSLSCFQRVSSAPLSLVAPLRSLCVVRADAERWFKDNRQLPVLVGAISLSVRSL